MDDVTGRDPMRDRTLVEHDETTVGIDVDGRADQLVGSTFDANPAPERVEQLAIPGVDDVG